MVHVKKVSANIKAKIKAAKIKNDNICFMRAVNKTYRSLKASCSKTCESRAVEKQGGTLKNNATFFLSAARLLLEPV